MMSWRRSPAARPGGPARPPLVCVHGAGVSSRELLPLVARLGEHADAWTVDLPGFGRSRKPAGQPLDLAAHADALAEWLDSAGLPAAVLIGTSFGCQIAVEVAVRHPHRVAGLVLIGPTVDPLGRSWLPLFGRWLANSAREDPRMGPLNLADYRDAGPRRVLGAFAAAIRDPVEEKLPLIEVPTLVVRGEYDRLVPQPWAEEAVRLLPRGRLVVLRGQPHMIPFRNPDALTPHITEFSEEVANGHADPEPARSEPPPADPPGEDGRRI